MANLSAGARFFSVIVPMPSRFAQHRRSLGHRADPVEHAGVADHAGIAQRQTQHSAQMILELRRFAAFDSPMSGVVHAWRKFVGEQFAVFAEQFHSEHTNIVQ